MDSQDRRKESSAHQKLDKEPLGWFQTTVGNLLQLEYGKSLTKDTRNSNGVIPVFGSSGIIGYHDEYLVAAPVLIVGRKGGVGEVFLSEDSCWPIDTVYFVRVPDILSLRFIFYLLKFLKLNQYDKSTAIPGLNRNDVYGIQIKIPPVKEQYRIVEKIEELFSDLDKGIESLKTTQQQLKIYRQAVLKWAFEGKLTAKWREEKKHKGELTSAEALLDQIKAEREKRDRTQLQEWHEAVKTWEANGKQGKKPAKPNKTKEVKALSEVEITNLPRLPEGWYWLRLQSLSIDITDGDHQPPPKANEGIPFVVISNINNNRIDFSSTRFVSADYYNNLQDYRKPRKGDILYTVTGSFGIPSLIDFDRAFCFQRHIGLIRLESQISRKYVFYLLQSEFCMQQARKVATGTAQKTVPLSGLRNFIIALPSLSEIKEIVQEIEFRLSICDRLEATITENLTRAEALRQSILKQAFEGKLVPQDPNDEPAEKLIERIRQEKLQSKNGQQLEFEI